MDIQAGSRSGNARGNKDAQSVRLSRLPYPLIFRYARCSKGSFDINLGHLPRSLGMNLSRSLEPVIQSEFLEIHRSLTSTLRSTEREKAQVIISMLLHRRVQRDGQSLKPGQLSNEDRR
ncbi:hypothetical protein WG66_014341 [Moniliophthora roreri]|nr:hypothetical protein WG66_014341 [Moniliophthora roreri]